MNAMGRHQCQGDGELNFAFGHVVQSGNDDFAFPLKASQNVALGAQDRKPHSRFLQRTINRCRLVPKRELSTAA